jgi:tetratricopeptide (TPR) repeat protein
LTAPTDGRGVPRSVLEEEQEFLLRSLRDLEAERAADDIDEIDYRSLRDDYTARAAEVVRQLAALDAAPAARALPGGPVRGTALERTALEGIPAEGARAEETPIEGGAPDSVPSAVDEGTPGAPGGDASPSGAEEGGRAATPWRRRILIGAAVLIVAGGVSTAVVGLSGKSPSGASRVAALDVAAQDAIGSAQYTKAIQDYEAALRIDPTDYVTLTGEGELLVEVGSNGSPPALKLGLSRLESAEIANPSYGPAFGARGLGFYDEGDDRAAISQFETYLADTPRADRSSAIEQDLATAEKRLASKGS